MDQETWRFINTFAPWLSAIGTLIAVAISLYVALRSEWQKLDVRVVLRNVRIGKDEPWVFLRPNMNSNIPPDLLMVFITNVRRRTAALAEIYWQAGHGKKFPLRPTPPNEYSCDFCGALKDGDYRYFSWPLEGSGGLKRDFRKDFGDEFAGFLGAIRLRRLKLCVETSIGDAYRVKPEREVLQLF
jgi:hypothetical protein